MTHGAVLFALILYAHSIIIVLYNVCIAFIVCLHCLHVVCIAYESPSIRNKFLNILG